MKPMRYVIIKTIKRKRPVVSTANTSFYDRLVEAYNEGFRDGQLDWLINNTGKNSYHDGYEQGWQDGYNEAMGLGED